MAQFHRLGNRLTPGVSAVLRKDIDALTHLRDLGRYLTDMALITEAFIGWYSSNCDGNNCARRKGAVIWGFVCILTQQAMKGGISRERAVVDAEDMSVKINIEHKKP